MVIPDAALEEVVVPLEMETDHLRGAMEIEDSAAEQMEAMITLLDSQEAFTATHLAQALLMAQVPVMAVAMGLGIKMGQAMEHLALQ